MNYLWLTLFPVLIVRIFVLGDLFIDGVEETDNEIDQSADSDGEYKA